VLKRLKISSEGVDSGSKNCYGGKDDVYGKASEVCVWRRVQSIASGGRFCVALFGLNPASVAMKRFSNGIYFIILL
jgi:hypothetical protein